VLVVVCDRSSLIVCVKSENEFETEFCASSDSRSQGVAASLRKNEFSRKLVLASLDHLADAHKVL
jgi:hypothetical protein